MVALLLLLASRSSTEAESVDQDLKSFLSSSADHFDIQTLAFVGELDSYSDSVLELMAELAKAELAKEASTMSSRRVGNSTGFSFFTDFTRSKTSRLRQAKRYRGE